MYVGYLLAERCVRDVDVVAGGRVATGVIDQCSAAPAGPQWFEMQSDIGEAIPPDDAREATGTTHAASS